MSESRNTEVDVERCCNAQRPASVSRVITTVETPHNTGRQREEGEERNGQKKEEQIETNMLTQTLQTGDKLKLFLHTIYHLAIQERAS